MNWSVGQPKRLTICRKSLRCKIWLNASTGNASFAGDMLARNRHRARHKLYARFVRINYDGTPVFYRNSTCYAAGSGDKAEPAALRLCSRQEDIESFDDVGLKAFKRAQNTLPFKGLSLIESYVEGSLWIAVEYCPPAANKSGRSGFLVLLNSQSHRAMHKTG